MFRKLAILCWIVGVGLAGCVQQPPSSPSEVTVVALDRPVTEPNDPVWSQVPVHSANLILQDMVEPRLLKPSITAVRVQGVSDGVQLTLRLEWEDPSRDDLPGAARFSDACAVQFPAAAAADLPAPQMGETGRAVQIVYWSASWQASVDGRADDIKALYPGASVDHYPFEAAPLEPGSQRQKELAELYAPARALGNPMQGPRAQPVEDLLAEGPGTLSPALQSVSKGRGVRTEAGWAVILERPLPPGLRPGERSQVAFAVWQGANQEVGARKMRSVWIPIFLEERS